MRRLIVGHDDPQRAVVDYLAEALDARSEGAAVGVALPGGWTPRAGRFVAVAWDGVPSSRARVLFRASVRVSCWASGPTDAKRLALLCQALLMGDHVPGVASVQLLAGVLPTRDPDNGGDLAYFTVRCNMRGRVL